jgi:elongation factor P
MKISANSIRLGNILVYKGDLWVVAKVPDHVKPGKGPAYVQVELKNLKTGSKLNERLSATEYLEKASLEQTKCQYLYTDNNQLVLMSVDDFEQIYVEAKILEDKVIYLQDNMEVVLETHDNRPLRIILPTTVILEINETSPHIKGSTVTSSYKPAFLSNGIRVMVPPYLEIGEKIVVKTEDDSFVERSK